MYEHLRLSVLQQNRPISDRFDGWSHLFAKIAWFRSSWPFIFSLEKFVTKYHLMLICRSVYYTNAKITLAVVYAIDERSMDCIFEIAWFRSNWQNTILYAVVLSFSSSGANCPEIGGELSGANCPRGELSEGRIVRIPFRFFLACTMFHQKPQMTFLGIRLGSLSLERMWIK